MNLCSDDHDEVCYGGMYCPACEMKEERDSAQKDLDAAEETIEKLESRIIELENGENA